MLNILINIAIIGLIAIAIATFILKIVEEIEYKKLDKEIRENKYEGHDEDIMDF